MQVESFSNALSVHCKQNQHAYWSVNRWQPVQLLSSKWDWRVNWSSEMQLFQPWACLLKKNLLVHEWIVITEHIRHVNGAFWSCSSHHYRASGKHIKSILLNRQCTSSCTIKAIEDQWGPFLNLRNAVTHNFLNIQHLFIFGCSPNNYIHTPYNVTVLWFESWLQDLLQDTKLSSHGLEEIPYTHIYIYRRHMNKGTHWHWNIRTQSQLRNASRNKKNYMSFNPYCSGDVMVQLYDIVCLWIEQIS